MDLKQIELYLNIALAGLMLLTVLIILFKFMFRKNRDLNGNGKIDKEETVTKDDLIFAKNFLAESIGIIINGLQANIGCTTQTAQKLLVNSIKEELKKKPEKKEKESEKNV